MARTDFYGKSGQGFLPKKLNAITVFNTNIDALVSSSAFPIFGNQAFLDAIRRGRGLEMQITGSVARRLSKLPAKKRMGGQAGIMANTLASLGVSVACHVAAPSKLQLNLLDRRVRTFSSPHGPSAVHYVLEFRKGQRIAGITAGGSNRLISTFDPANRGLRINKNFVKAVERRIHSFDFCIAGGFHLTDEEGIKNGTRILRRWKKRNPGLLVYVELGNFQRISARSAFSELSEVADVVGMNEVELAEVTGTDSISTGLTQLPCGTIVHTADFAVAKVAEEPVRWARALSFGCALAAAGKPALMKKLDLTQKKLHLGGNNLVFVPALKVRPEVTVGSGDIFTAGLVAHLVGQ